MVKYYVLLAVLLIAPVGSLCAQDSDNGQLPSIYTTYHAGIRLGGWINNGETIPPLAVDTAADAILETDIKDGSFYFEAYAAYAVLPRTYAEISIGVVNRGSVSVFQGPFSDIGNLVLYPVLLQLKHYPLAEVRSKLQPFVAVGGGVYYGRQDVQFTNDVFFTDYREDSETDFNYTLSGGVDWILNNFLTLELHSRYMPINFSETLVTAHDYQAFSVTVGVKYLFGDNK